MTTVVTCVHVFPGEQGCQLIRGELRSNWGESKQVRELVLRCPRLPRSGADVGREVLAGEGGAGGDEVGGGALEDDPAAIVAGAGAEVDDPVGVRHDRLVVLDDDDRLAGVDEPVEQAEQLLDVGEVEAGGRLVEDVDAALLGHVGGQLEPLPLAAGQRSERLAEAEVAEPDVGEPVEDGVRGRRARLAGAEELLGLGHRHREHLADVAAAEVVIQHRCLEPLPLALLADGGGAGFTPLAFANALRIGSSSPVYVAGLLRREPRIAPWPIDTTPAPAGIDPCTSELFPEPATPVTTTRTPSGMSSTSRRLCAVAPRI